MSSRESRDGAGGAVSAGGPLILAVSFADADVHSLGALESHLALLVANGTFRLVHRQRLSAGRARQDANAILTEADILILLVSADYHRERRSEMTLAMMQRNRGAQVVPILVRETSITGAPYADLQMLPATGGSIGASSNADQAWSAIALRLADLARQVNAGEPVRPDPVASNTPEGTSDFMGSPAPLSHREEETAMDGGPLPSWLFAFWGLALYFHIHYRNRRRKALGTYLGQFVERMAVENSKPLLPGNYIEPYAVHGTDVGPRYRHPQTRRRSPHVSASVWELDGLQSGGTRASGDLARAQHPSRLVRDVVSRLLRARAPIVLLAEPGFGKSMTLRRVGMLIAERGRCEWEPVVPIYVRLGDFRTPKPDVPSVLSFVRNQFHREDVNLVGTFDDLLRGGKLVLLMDGMDEMDRVDYARRVQALCDFANAYATACKILFACRKNDFIPTFKQHQMVLVEFDRQQARQFLRGNLFSDGAGRSTSVRIGNKEYGPGQAAEVLELFRVPLMESVHNPLFLALCSAFALETGRLPTVRGDLFRWFVYELAGKLRERTQAPQDLDIHQVVGAWGELAFVVTRHAAGTVIAEEELLQYLGASRPPSVAWGLEAGLLRMDSDPSEKGAVAIAFVHHRLQEYLTAYHLHSGSPAGRDFWSGVLDIPRWQEVILHLATMVSGPDKVFDVLMETLRFDHRYADIEEESTAADRVILAARVAATSAACIDPSKVTAALVQMAERGRPPSQMRALQAAMFVGGARKPVSRVLIESHLGWIRRQAKLVEALAEREEEDDPRLEMGQDLVSLEWWKTAPDYWFLVRQKGARRWAPAFAAAVLAWMAGALVGYGTPLAILGLTMLSLPRETFRAWPVLIIASPAVMLAMGGLAKLIRGKWLENPHHAQAVSVGISVVLMLLVETALTAGPVGTLLMLLAGAGLGAAVGALAVILGAITRLLSFGVLAAPYGWSLQNLAALIRRSYEGQKVGVDVKVGDALAILWGSDLLFLLLAVAAAKAGVNAPANLAGFVLGLLLAFLSVFLVTLEMVPDFFRWLLGGAEGSTRWARVRSRAWSVGGWVIWMVVGMPVLGAILVGCGWLLDKSRSFERGTPAFSIWSIRVLLIAFVVVCLLIARALLAEPIRALIQRFREKREASRQADRLRRAYVDRGWDSPGLDDWKKHFRNATTPEAQVALLLPLREAATKGQGNLESFLGALGEVENCVAADPAGSEYWAAMEELLSIQRQSRHLSLDTRALRPD